MKRWWMCPLLLGVGLAPVIALAGVLYLEYFVSPTPLQDRAEVWNDRLP